ncbi:MAG: UDP-glucose/GDP-mannose dehydrogenase family protein [Pseudomonadota bacterium]|nr:UDP-glucose/GDP-mannose dehydrogenase family protein [Pseudomonadota bacterium]
MRVVIIGAGYVGLVSGACFAELGVDVVVVESDAAKLEMLRQGRTPIHEPGLDALIAANVAAARLRFSDDIGEAVLAADLVFIAVGTPSRRGDGHSDLRFVFRAVEQLAPYLKNGAVVVTKSTVPVGTGRRIAEILREMRPEITVDVASNPEFLREGAAIDDFLKPDRVIVGASSDHAHALLDRLYRPILQQGRPILFTSLETAELTKYAANVFLAMKVTFINEIADLCEKVGADVEDIAHGIGLDSRIGRKFLQPGPGFGGSCFPKDTLALVRTAQEAGAPIRLAETVVSVNDARKAGMGGRVIAACGGSVRGRRIAVLGLAFKPNTDDMRDSPSIGVIQRLVEDGAEVRAFDPVAMDQARPLMPASVRFCQDWQEAARGADALVIATEWGEFRRIAVGRLAELMRGRVVVDLRNVFDPHALSAAGFVCHPIGRAPVGASAESTRRRGSQPAARSFDLAEASA